MFARERKEALLIYLKQHKKATIQEFVDEFHVTGATIRTDLRELEKAGLVIRTHGGAVLNQDKIEKESNLAMRHEIYTVEKRKIGKKAIDFVEEGDVILIDSGTTAAEFAAGLTTFHHLKVVTNDLPIAIELQKNPEIDVIIIGGNVRNGFECTVGSFGLEFLKEISVDKVFIVPNALSVTQGVTAPYEETAAIKKAMMKTASKRYLLSDSSKIGKKTFCKVSDLKEFNCLITDEGVSEEDISAIKKQGLDVVICN